MLGPSTEVNIIVESNTPITLYLYFLTSCCGFLKSMNSLVLV